MRAGFTATQKAARCPKMGSSRASQYKKITVFRLTAGEVKKFLRETFEKIGKTFNETALRLKQFQLHYFLAVIVAGIVHCVELVRCAL